MSEKKSTEDVLREQFAKAEKVEAVEEVTGTNGAETENAESAPVLEASGEETETPAKADSETDPKASSVEEEVNAALEDDADDFEPILPPARFTAEQKEAFRKYPREAQQAIADMVRQHEGGLTRKFQELSQRERFVTPILDAVQPYVEEYARQNIGIQQVVSGAIAWDRAIRQQGVPAAIQFLQSYGITPQQVLGYQPGQQQMPDVQSLVAEHVQQALAPYQQRELAQQQAAVTAALDSWRSAKDDKGQPKYPYAAQLEGEMTPIVKALRLADPDASAQSLLAKAYNTVLLDHPEIQEAIEKKKAAASRRAQLEKQNQKAKEAQRKAVGIQGGLAPKSGKQVPKNDTAALIKAQMDGEIEVIR